jgi:hypothetical protein
MNAWLVNGGHYENLDLPGLLSRIQGHETIHFEFEGVKYIKTRKEIEAKIHSTLCSACQKYRVMLYLNDVPPEIDPKELIRAFISKNYIKHRFRVYARRRLYQEIQEFLDGYNVHLDKSLEKYIINDIFQDSSPQYRKLKIRRLDNTHEKET